MSVKSFVAEDILGKNSFVGMGNFPGLDGMPVGLESQPNNGIPSGPHIFNLKTGDSGPQVGKIMCIIYIYTYPP